MSARVPFAAMLRAPLAIERPVDVPDGGGGFVRSWATVASVWAHLEPASGRETWAGMQRAATVTHRVRIRYREDVGAEMRLVAGARVFAVRGAYDPDGRRAVLEILAEEGGTFHDA